MVFWKTSEVERFMPRFRALNSADIKIIALYEVNDLADNIYNKWSKVVDFIKIEMVDYQWYFKWLFNRNYITQQIEDLDFDIVFSLSGMWLQYYSRFIAMKLKKPYVVYLRGDEFKAQNLQSKNKWLRAIRLFIYRKYCWGCDLVIPISEGMRELALSLDIPEKDISKVVSGGIDTKLFYPRYIRNSKLKIGYLGRINKEKGSDFLSELIKSNPDVDFKIAGDMQVPFEILDNVDYKGFIPHEEVPIFINECDIIILVSKTEGFARAILEAYSCAKPIMVTPESLPKGCNKYGFILPRDLQVWTDKIETLRHRRGYLFTIGNIAREYVLKYRLEKYGLDMKRELKEVL